jgi:hypothetical protein
MHLLTYYAGQLKELNSEWLIVLWDPEPSYERLYISQRNLFGPDITTPLGYLYVWTDLTGYMDEIVYRPHENTKPQATRRVRQALKIIRTRKSMMDSRQNNEQT